MTSQPSFTIGIEEEYMLVNPHTGDLVRKAPRSLMPAMKAKLGSRVSPEFLQSQVEVGTPVCASLQQANDELGNLRQSVAEVAQDHDLAIIAASTHPFARPQDQAITKKARYAELAQDLQAVVRRLLISGMHVHVGIDDDDLRVDLMNQATYILPHLLALSTSSPFWTGEDTGLKSYRMSVWDEMPRTGLPHVFESYSEYQRHVNVLVEAGVIEDATKVWWDLRPSARYPTLEMRITDLCATLKDAICIAAIYQCWLRMLYRLRARNQKWRKYSNMLLDENRWRAQRYGIDQGLIDFGIGKVVNYSDLLSEILTLIRQDAIEAGCLQEINHAKTIVKRGTSAHRQLSVYKKSLEKGDSHELAIKKVVDWLRRETLNC
ncbi:carboxylate-amine ligase [Candidatus Spongiihabitans sp.]|uniref:carboxylate-amine ligase n=1 Tax=Candidatus Spongiihabitans sp. TaxID=3101308 RepID=UPI003C7C81FA